MKCQILLSWKNKKKSISKCRLLKILPKSAKRYVDTLYSDAWESADNKCDIFLTGRMLRKYTFGHVHPVRSRPEVIKLFSCSAQLSMKFVLLLYLKLLTIANSVLLNIAEHENFSANKYENANYCWHFHIYLQGKFHAQLS